MNIIVQLNQNKYFEFATIRF